MDKYCQAISNGCQFSGHKKWHIPCTVFSQALAGKLAHAAAILLDDKWLPFSSSDIQQIFLSSGNEVTPKPSVFRKIYRSLILIFPRWLYIQQSLSSSFHSLSSRKDFTHLSGLNIVDNTKIKILPELLPKCIPKKTCSLPPAAVIAVLKLKPITGTKTVKGRYHKQSVKGQSDLSQATNFMQQWGESIVHKKGRRNIAVIETFLR